LVAGLRALGVLYVLGASALGFGLALQAGQPWALGVKSMAEAAPPAVGSATASTVRAVNEAALKPAWAFLRQTADAAARQVAEWTGPKPVVASKPAPRVAAVRQKPPALRPSVIPERPPQRQAERQAMELAPQTDALPLTPAPDPAPPSPGEIGRVLAHLKVSLTRELYENFSLFLYISKAERGPWHQRLFAFAKEANGDLKLLYAFPVSTGREVPAPSPDGRQMWHTDTPTGYFQLDPERIYRRYTSQQWQHPMPYAMFFNWEHDGLQTGIAIHSAVGEDVGLLGGRASAGCVRLHPQNAQLLFRLIRANYRGLAPRFAYDRRTATMSKEGLLMHDRSGALQFAEGYKVLVLIENHTGDDIVAALF
jgi:lipoprotein-anchoring transpeptidase ErfK/SrfK